MIFRDRDANTAWKSAADSTREERRYYCQNWRADVSAVLTSDGKMVEWVKYSAYGIPFALPAGDTDSDGDWDATDSSNITFASTYNVRLDANLDGTVNASDITHANSITGGYQTLGRGKLSAGGIGGGSSNRRGYAGYEYDPTFNGAGRHLYHVRHRVYDAQVGRWTRRDPLGYIDGMGLYEYTSSLPMVSYDPDGRFGIAFTGADGHCEAQWGSCPTMQPLAGGITSIDGSIRQCLAMPSINQKITCLEGLLNIFPGTRWDAMIRRMIERVRTTEKWLREGKKTAGLSKKCTALYVAYKIACDACGSCSTTTDCWVACADAACHGACLAARKKYDKDKCPGWDGPGHKDAKKTHTSALQKCLTRCKSAECRKEIVSTLSHDIPIECNP